MFWFSDIKISFIYALSSIGLVYALYVTHIDILSIICNSYTMVCPPVREIINLLKRLDILAQADTPCL